MREYGVIYSTYWQTTRNEGWPDDAKTLGAYLLSCGHGSIAGVFSLPVGYVCEDLSWSRERVIEGFRYCSVNGFVAVCETTQWVWIRKFLQWNPLENPNQIKAAAKAVDQISRKCAWLAEFVDFFKPFTRPLENPSKRVPKRLPEPSLNQEQHQHQEQEQHQHQTGGPDPAAVAAASTPREPKRRARTKSSGVPMSEFHEAIVKAYHELCRALPRVEVWTERRRDLLEARIQDRCGAGKPADTPQYWRGFFENVAASDFLCGRKTDWRADFQWLLSPEPFLKVIEGKYANNNTNPPAQRSFGAHGNPP